MKITPHTSGASRLQAQQKNKDRHGTAEWAAWAFILVAVGRLTELVPGFGNLPLAKIAAVVWLIALFSRPRSAALPPLLTIPMVRTALALVVLAVLSVVFSIWRSGSLAFMLGAGAVAALAYVLMCRTAVRWEFVVATLRCFVFTGVMLALCALASSGGGRIAAGISYDTNDLAYVLVTILPIAIAFAVTTAGAKRMFYSSIVGLLVLSILFTQSRGGLIAILAIVLFLILVDLKPPAKPAKLGEAISKRLVRLMVCVLLCAATWAVLPAPTKERLSTLTNLNADYNMDSSLKSSRTAIWKRNLGALADRPIGFGVESFMAVDGRYGGQWKAAHNSVLQVSVELGVLGFFLYMRMYWLAWTSLGRTGSQAPDGRADIDKIVFSRALRICLVSNFIAAFFLSMAYSNLLWTLFATITIFTAMDTSEKIAADVTTKKRPARRPAAMPAVANRRQPSLRHHERSL